MDLTHDFTVPTDPDRTWEHFQDVAALAECFPGARVTETDGDSFSGSCKVKLGPIALTYQGSGTFVERDDAARRFVVEAKGKDKRGNGTANATVTLSMEPADAGGTAVRVVTELAITGKPAQFGRGVMQDVSDKLLGQFVSCLEDRLDTSAASGEPAGASAGPTSHSDDSDRDSDRDTDATPPATATVATAPAPQAGSSGSTTSASSPAQDDALDLGATALPVLLRAYGKQIAGVVAVLVVLRWLLRRR